MSLNLPQLASQGRAHSAARPWTNAELEALITLERDRKLSRQTAADYIRNGVMTPEDYDKAVKADLKPQALEDIHEDAEKAVKENTKAKLGKKK